MKDILSLHQYFDKSTDNSQAYIK